MKNLLTLLFLAANAIAFGQTDFDERLLAKFSEEKIRSMKSTSPQTIAFMEYYLEQGFDIDTQVKAKPTSYRGEISIKSLAREEINLFDLDIPLPLDGPAYYRIKSTDKYLIIHPRKTVMASFNKENSY